MLQAPDSRPPPPPTKTGTDAHWWILCRVVDNFGDAGVCWRLARQLACEHGARVRLFIDLPALIDRLAGGDRASVDPAGVAVHPWPQDGPPAGVEPDALPDALLCAFGCEPPGWLRRQLADAPARPLWLHLEYLSAEPWVDGCHGLSSVKPADGAIEHFFYPGFTPATGGLLREHDALAPPPPDEVLRARLLGRLCGHPPSPGERVISLFCYPQAPLAELLQLLAEAAHPTLLLVPDGVAEGIPEAFIDAVKAPGTEPTRLVPGAAPQGRGRLRIARIPFLPQRDYDALLRLADLNFVRGEDSWIRAHWARRPFVWQPYRQPDAAHEVKLAAFLARLHETAASLAGSAAPAGPFIAGMAALDALMRAWSGDGKLRSAWHAYERHDAAAAAVLHRWTDSLARQPDLAGNLGRWLARHQQQGRL